MQASSLQRGLCALALVASCALPTDGAAQADSAANLGAPLHAAAEATAVPFRSGQWAAQLSMGPGVGSIGVLRFVSPRSALLLDVRLFVESAQSDVDVQSPAGNGTGDVRQSSVVIDLRGGWRTYHPLGPRVVMHTSLGLLAGRFVDNLDFDSEDFIPFEQTVHGWAAGPFFELGASFMPAPRLGLGMTWSPELTYGRTTAENGGGGEKTTETVRVLRFDGSGVTLTATIFF
jgi:hypothetical protein